MRQLKRTQIKEKREIENACYKDCICIRGAILKVIKVFLTGLKFGGKPVKLFM